MKSTRHWWILAGIVVIGAVLRVMYLAEYAKTSDFRVPLLDYLYHDYWAKLVAFGEAELPAGTPDPLLDQRAYFRPPGYSYFLAGVYKVLGSGPYVARVANGLLGLAGVVLGYAFAARWFGRRVGLILAALMAVSWTFIYYEGKIHEPPLLVVLGLGMMMALGRLGERLRPGPAAAGGLLLGLFALVRPNILPFAAGVLAWMAWRGWREGEIRRAWIPGLAFVGALGLAVAPAAIRNRVVAGDTVLISANSGVNLLFGNYEGSNGVAACHPEMGAWSCFDYPAVVAGLERRLGHPVTYGESSAYFTRRAWGFMKAHPGAAARLTVRKLLLFWAPMEVDSVYDVNTERKESRIIGSLPLQMPLLLALAGTGLLLFAAQRPKAGDPGVAAREGQVALVVLVGLLVALYTLPHGLYIVSSRYRVPMLPFLLLGGAYGLSELGRMLEERRMRSLVLWLAVVAGGFWVASRNPTGYQPKPVTWAMNTALADLLAGDVERAIPKLEAVSKAEPWNPQPVARLGFCFERQRDYRRAEESFREALARDPRFLEARIGLGQVLMQQNRAGEGIEEFRRAVELAPGNAQARELLGNALLIQGKVPEAVVELTEAIRLNPRVFEAHMGLGAIFLNQGKTEDAIGHFAEAARLKPGDPQIQRLMQMLPEIGRRAGGAGR